MLLTRPNSKRGLHYLTSMRYILKFSWICLTYHLFKIRIGNIKQVIKLASSAVRIKSVGLFVFIYYLLLLPFCWFLSGEVLDCIDS